MDNSLVALKAVGRAVQRAVSRVHSMAGEMADLLVARTVDL